VHRLVARLLMWGTTSMVPRQLLLLLPHIWCCLCCRQCNRGSRHCIRRAN